MDLPLNDKVAFTALPGAEDCIELLFVMDRLSVLTAGVTTGVGITLLSGAWVTIADGNGVLEGVVCGDAVVIGAFVSRPGFDVGLGVGVMVTEGLGVDVTFGVGAGVFSIITVFSNTLKLFSVLI